MARLGEIRITQGCSLCGAGHDRGMCRDEYGSEFTYSGQVGCNSCKTSGFPGTHSECVRIGFNGDPRACCYFGNSFAGTCDPRYTENRFTSEVCEPAWNASCEGDNIFGLGPCKEWAERDPQAAERRVRQFCSDKLGRNADCQQWVRQNREFSDGIYTNYCNSVQRMREPICQDWARTDPASNPDGFGGMGKLDSLMFMYCQQNPNDAICNCINSSVRNFGGNFNPFCIDANCATSGYATSPMLAGRPCPDITNCSQILDFEAAGINFTDNVLSQACGPETPSPVPAPPAPPTEPSDRPPAPREDPIDNLDIQPESLLDRFNNLSTEMRILIVFIFLIVIAVAVGLIAYGVVAGDKSGGYFDKFR